MSYKECNLELSHSHIRIQVDIRLIYFASSCRNISLAEMITKVLSWQIKRKSVVEILLKLHTENISYGCKVIQRRKRRWWTSTMHENGAILQERHSTAISLYRPVLYKPGSTHCEACTANLFFPPIIPQTVFRSMTFRISNSLCNYLETKQANKQKQQQQNVKKN